VLPRFPDETDALPQFSLDPTGGPDAERTLEYRALGPSDLELIEEERSTPPSIVPVALEASDLEEEFEGEELAETIVLPRRELPWRAMSIGLAAMAALALGWLVTSSTSAGDTSTVAAALAPLPKLPVELPAPPPAPIVEATPPPAAPPVPTTGTIVTPQWAKGRRVWVDGKPIAGHAPKLEAACGKHSVRIGAYGKTRKVEIPCGGELSIAP
jgi:hypothetical protein